MTQVSIFGYYGQQNIGDEAILSALLSDMRELDPFSRITVFSSDPLYSKQIHDVASQPSIIPTSLRKLAIRSLGRQRKTFFSATRQFLRSDLIIIGGGGLFYDTKDSNRNLLEITRLISVAKNLLRKRVFITGVSVGPIFHSKSIRALRRALSRVDGIVVRDEKSKALLNEFGLAAKGIRVIPDLAFKLKPCSSERLKDIISNESLGLTGKPIIAVTPCSYNHHAPGWLNTYEDFCVHAIDNLSAEVWLIPMQTSAANDDRLTTREIARRVGRARFLKCVEGIYRPQDILGLIGSADSILAERFHGAILAISAAVPVLAIGYMPKVTRLFGDLGHPEWCIDATMLDAQSVISNFDSVFQSRSDIQRELKRIASDLKDSMGNALEITRHD